MPPSRVDDGVAFDGNPTRIRDFSVNSTPAARDVRVAWPRLHGHEARRIGSVGGWGSWPRRRGHATPGLRGSGVDPESLRIAVEIGANSRYFPRISARVRVQST